MNFDNVIEKRNVDNGLHSMVLEMSADEYREDYGELNDDFASNILDRYLEYRGDDGRPTDVRIGYDDRHNVVKIYANVQYLDNDHTTYKFRM